MNRPFAEKDELGRTRVSWNDERGRSCMPVWKLAEDGSELPLPGDHKSLTKGDVAKLRCAIFMSERGSGVARLVRWLLKQCGIEGAAVRGPDGALVWSPKAATNTTLQRNWGAALCDLRTGDAQRVDALATLIGAPRKAPFLLILRLNDSPQDFDQTREFVARLRGCYEDHATLLRIVLTTVWPDLISDTLEQSGFLSISDAYRLAAFDTDAIRTMMSGFQHLKGEVVTDATVAEIRKVTGGQPHLIECFLQELGRIVRYRPTTDTKGEALRAELPLAQHRLANSPPAIVTIWQAHLQGLLHRRPELRLPLERYVEGQTLSADLPYRYPPPRHEWHLYAAGWVGPDASGSEWGIRSLLHQEWARQVIAGGRHD